MFGHNDMGLGRIDESLVGTSTQLNHMQIRLSSHPSHRIQRRMSSVDSTKLSARISARFKVPESALDPENHCWNQEQEKLVLERLMKNEKLIKGFNRAHRESDSAQKYRSHVRKQLSRQNLNKKKKSAERLNLFLQQQAAEHEGIAAENTERDTEAADNKDKSKKDKWKEIALITLPHVGLVLISAMYTILGAVMFYCIEQPHERQLRNISMTNIYNKMEIMQQRLWTISRMDNITQADFKFQSDELVIGILKDAYTSFTRHYVAPEDFLHEEEGRRVRWSFAASVFFSWTAITTIGYGHIVPLTTGGRIACLVYALFGIPLILVTIADMGRFLSSGIIWIHIASRRCYQWTCVNLTRCGQCLTNSTRHLSGAKTSRQHNHNANKPGEPPGSPDKSGTFEDISEIQSQSHPISQETQREAEEIPEDQSRPPDEQEYEQSSAPRISVTFVLIIMVGYTAGGACLLRTWEGWSFFDAFYYCFVTVTTIGFGDIVPHQEHFFWATLLYIVLGLIITTMCIDLVGSEYIRDIHFYGRNIGRLTRAAFMSFGGRVVHVGEVFGYVSFLQKQYGLTVDQIEKMAQLPDAYLLECLLAGKQPNLAWLNTPYVPYDIFYFKWIEQPKTLSYVSSDKVFASMESLDVTSRCSTARTPREYYQHILMQYVKDIDTKL